MLKKFNSKTPKIGKNAFIENSAQIIGNVEIGDNSSVWFNAVIRGDEDKIRIGESTNVQDGCVLHADKDFPLIILNNVPLGLGAIAHGCKINNNCLIGMGAVIMNGVEIGENSIIAAGSVVRAGMKVEARSIFGGVPAKKLRDVTEEDIKLINRHTELYLKIKNEYLN